MTELGIMGIEVEIVSQEELELWDATILQAEAASASNRRAGAHMQS